MAPRFRSLARPRPGAPARGNAHLPGRAARGRALPLLLALLALLAWALLPAPLGAGEWTGKYANGTAITTGELQQRLDNHEEWLESNGAKGRQAEFTGADLAQAELERADLSGARLENADLREANLEEADLSKAGLEHADLTEARLTSTNLTGARLRNAILIRADLSNADLSRAGLNHANMTEAFLENAKLSGADLTSADLSRTYLAQAVLSGATLRRANLSEALLNEANLNRANIEAANLAGAHLVGARMRNATLWEANLSGAEMWMANLSHAYLGEAKLPKAQLMGANLSNTYLGYADFSGANLENTNLSNAVLAQTDLSKAQLTNATLSNATLWLTKIKDARLFMANMTGARYACEGVPDKDSLGGIAGLSTLDCDVRFISGPVQLRNALRETGLRDLEREATYAIERARTAAAPPLERWFRTVLFDWPSAYGMRPGRPLWLMLGVFLAFIPVYWAALWRPKGAEPARAGEGTETGPGPAEPGQPDAPPSGSLPRAAFYSLLFTPFFSLAYFHAWQPEWPSPNLLTPLFFSFLALAYWLILWRAGISDGPHLIRGRDPGPERPSLSARLRAVFAFILPGLASAGLFALPLCLGADCGWPVGLLALATAFCAMVPFYWMAGLRAAGRDGVYLVWSEKRIRQDLGANAPLRLRRSGFRAIPWAAYFSLLSAFNLGFREINVGNWIVRIQPREYGLQATGWVRTAAGAQSLLSLYFLAWWVLTYFYRPFE